MTLKRIPSRFLCEALDVASQLAHAQASEEIGLSHIVYGAFERLHEYRTKILGPGGDSPQLAGILRLMKNQFSVPLNLPEKNGASQSMIVDQAVKNAHRRARLTGRNFVLLEDLVTVLLESRWVMKLFSGRDADKDFLAGVHAQCKQPLRTTLCKRPVAVRPQFDRKRQKGPRR